jgi:flavin-dependent dehydrogenase
VTNVCGLAPERQLLAVNFEIDEFVHGCRPLRDRLAPLTRTMEWMRVGPLVFQNRLVSPTEPYVYPAGDALSFVDPFTGSGILSAVLTGGLAGESAARGVDATDYLVRCRAALGRPFLAASFLRMVLRSRWAEPLVALTPPAALYRITRPLTKN